MKNVISISIFFNNIIELLILTGVLLYKYIPVYFSFKKSLFDFDNYRRYSHKIKPEGVILIVTHLYYFQKTHFIVTEKLIKQSNLNNIIIFEPSCKCQEFIDLYTWAKLGYFEAGGRIIYFRKQTFWLKR